MTHDTLLFSERQICYLLWLSLQRGWNLPDFYFLQHTKQDSCHQERKCKQLSLRPIILWIVLWWTGNVSRVCPVFHLKTGGIGFSRPPWTFIWRPGTDNGWILYDLFTSLLFSIKDKCNLPLKMLLYQILTQHILIKHYFSHLRVTYYRPKIENNRVNHCVKHLLLWHMHALSYFLF